MTRLEMVAALRKAADFFETNEICNERWRVEVTNHDATRDDMANFIRAVGKVRKNGVDSTFWVSGEVAGIEATLFARSREDVCRKVVTKKVLPAEPEKIIPAQPEREVEEVAWDCEPILASK